MSLHEDDLPVLNDVVESGNRSIIQSTRMGNEVLRELESLRQDAARLPVHEDTSESDTLAPETAALVDAPAVEIPQGLDFASVTQTLDPPSQEGLSEDEIEIMIDDIVDRHITALRRDIKRLLERTRSSP